MSGFTKGEWVVDMGAKVYQDDPTGRIIAQCDEFSFVPRSDAEKLANAHLIAAAPKMYELLEKWSQLADCVNDGYEYGLREETDELLKQARGDV